MSGGILYHVIRGNVEKDAQQQQIAAMEASLTALKQVVGAHTTPERLSFSSLSAGWPLFGGCFSSG